MSCTEPSKRSVVTAERTSTPNEFVTKLTLSEPPAETPAKDTRIHSGSYTVVPPIWTPTIGDIEVHIIRCRWKSPPNDLSAHSVVVNYDVELGMGLGRQIWLRPWLELDFEDYRPYLAGRMYLFAVRFSIPSSDEFKRLLFHPSTTYGGDVQANRGWELQAYDALHNELSVKCQDWNIGSNAAEYTEGLTQVTHVCLPQTASDSDYDVLSRARFLRLTLIGEYRQIWVDKIDVYFREITDIAR